MANRLEIAFIASPALLLVTANEVRQTFTQRFTPVPAEQPWGVRCPGRGDPPLPSGDQVWACLGGTAHPADPVSIPHGTGERQRAGWDGGVNKSAPRPSNLSQLTSQ